MFNSFENNRVDFSVYTLQNTIDFAFQVFPMMSHLQLWVR